MSQKRSDRRICRHSLAGRASLPDTRVFGNSAGERMLPATTACSYVKQSQLSPCENMYKLQVFVPLQWSATVIESRQDLGRG